MKSKLSLARRIFRHLVEGVTKLSKFNFDSKTEQQARLSPDVSGNGRRHPRHCGQASRPSAAICVRFSTCARTDRVRIARETLEIFAPLANRLGIGRFKWELEDLCFKYLEPEAYRELTQLIVDKRADREERLQQVSNVLKRASASSVSNARMLAVGPNICMAFTRKCTVRAKNCKRSTIFPAVRLIVNTKDECYRALAVAHDLYRPIPGRFKDYIGLPKPNRYQSLHTVVIGPRSPDRSANSHGRNAAVLLNLGVNVAGNPEEYRQR